MLRDESLLQIFECENTHRVGAAQGFSHLSTEDLGAGLHIYI